MADKVEIIQGGIGLPSMLFLVFLVLKLTDKIDWSWWWITSPLWIPWGFAAFILIFFFLLFLIGLAKS